MERLERPNDYTKKSVALLKPGFIDRIMTGQLTYSEVFEGLLYSLEMHVLARRDVTLNKGEVLQLYSDIFTRSPRYDIDKALRFRGSLLKYMSTDTCRAYLIEGDHSDRNLEILKRDFRRFGKNKGDTTAVRNIIHVPDSEELATTRRILFP